MSACDLVPRYVVHLSGYPSIMFIICQSGAGAECDKVTLCKNAILCCAGDHLVPGLCLCCLSLSLCSRFEELP